MIMRKIPAIPIILTIAVLAASFGAAIYIVNQKNASAHNAAAQAVVYHCPMHPGYLSHHSGQCPICGMDLVPMDAVDPQIVAPDSRIGVKIDPTMIQSMGVQTEKATSRTLTRDIRATATVMPDERRKTIITTKIMGYVEKLHVNYTGQLVKTGQPLYELYSPDLVSAQSEYLQTYKNLASKDSGQLLRSARQRLLNWDVTEAQISALEKRGVPEKSMTIISPVGGIVAEKMIVEGQSIEPGMPLYKIIDYSRVWVECAIYQQDIPLVSVGQHGSIELDYYPGRQFSGSLVYISPELNRESRTLMVRFELANTSDVKIKPGMNATVTIHEIISSGAVTVPDLAVIRSGLRTLVVIAKGGGYFEPREIKVGQSAEGYTEVVEGVTAGDEIVTSSQFLIDSESNLKAAVVKMDHGTAPKSDSAQPSISGTDVMHTTEDGADSVMYDAKNSQKTAVDKSFQLMYTCPMDPEIVSDKPASCPKCKMKLVLKKP